MKNQWVRRAKNKYVWDFETEKGDAVKEKYQHKFKCVYQAPGVFQVGKPAITGDDVLYVSNASGAIRLHLVDGGFIELNGTADEIADTIHDLFMRGRNAS